MPPIVRLPGHVPEGELRVYWDSTDEGACLHVQGERAVRHLGLHAIAGQRLGIRHWVSLADRFTLNQRSLENLPSVADVLVEQGYDLTTLVFSIRKAGAPPPAEAEVADDIRKRLEDVQAALKMLAGAVAMADEAKGVWVLDESERDAIVDAADEAGAAAARAIDLLDGKADAPGRGA